MCLLNIHIRAPTPARTLNTAQGYARDPPSRRASRWPRRHAARRTAGTRMRRLPGVSMVARRRVWLIVTCHPHAAARPRAAPALPRRALQELSASGCRPARAVAAGRCAAVRTQSVELRGRSSRASRSSRAPPRSLPRVVLALQQLSRPEPRLVAVLLVDLETCEKCTLSVHTFLARKHR